MQLAFGEKHPRVVTFFLTLFSIATIGAKSKVLLQSRPTLRAEPGISIFTGRFGHFAKIHFRAIFQLFSIFGIHVVNGTTALHLEKIAFIPPKQRYKKQVKIGVLIDQSSTTIPFTILTHEIDNFPYYFLSILYPKYSYKKHRILLSKRIHLPILPDITFPCYHYLNIIPINFLS